jgi:hypothetical protein
VPETPRIRSTTKILRLARRAGKLLDELDPRIAGGTLQQLDRIMDEIEQLAEKMDARTGKPDPKHRRRAAKRKKL